MKRIFVLVAIVTVAFTSFSQSLGFSDIGVLFGQDQNYGTSRFNAMSGAFGALGGDVSATGINPAGAAVARNSSISVTLGNRNTKVDASYYGNMINSEDDFFNVSQAGGILTFDSAYDSEWNRFAFTFNYKIKNDFEGAFSAGGNSGRALFNEHPNDQSNPINYYNNGQEQRFSSTMTGQTSVFSIGFSSVHENKLFVGGTINMHDLQFNQITHLNETNKDNNGNILKAFNEQKSNFDGAGLSLSLGFIYKAHQAFRFGLAYESPTWYQEIVEESNLSQFDPNLKHRRYENWVGNTQISATNIVANINMVKEPNNYSFKLKTPSRITASTAFVFGKKGLLSIDYTYKGYKNTKFNNGDFVNINKTLANDFKDTHAVNIGTEWRFDKMSLRAGYHYEQAPDKGALKKDHLKGFSVGLGYNFGSAKFDLAYKNSKKNSPYYIYNSGNMGSVNPIELKNNTSRITGTITFDL